MSKYLKEKEIEFRNMSNALLLSTVIDLHWPDYYDSYWTKEGQNDFSLAYKILEERLGDWLIKDLPNYYTFVLNSKSRILLVFDKMYNKFNKTNPDISKEEYYNKNILYFNVDIVGD
jgi:hypothetical protein